MSCDGVKVRGPRVHTFRRTTEDRGRATPRASAFGVRQADRVATVTDQPPRSDTARPLTVAQFTDNYGPGSNGLMFAVQQLEGNLLDAGHKVVVVAQAAGPTQFADPKFAEEFARAASAALGKPVVHVDVAALSISY